MPLVWRGWGANPRPSYPEADAIGAGLDTSDTTTFLIPYVQDNAHKSILVYRELGLYTCVPKASHMIHVLTQCYFLPGSHFRMLDHFPFEHLEYRANKSLRTGRPSLSILNPALHFI